MTARGWWLAAGASLLVAACALAFAAYLRPEMLATFGEIMAFCAALIR